MAWSGWTATAGPVPTVTAGECSTMVELDFGQFWMLDSGEVVQVTGIGGVVLTLLDPETRDRWHVRRTTFEQRIAEGRATQVEPNWEPTAPVTAGT